MNNKQQELFKKELLMFPENIINTNTSQEITLNDFLESDDLNIFKNLHFQYSTQWFTLEYLMYLININNESDNDTNNESDNDTNKRILQQITQASFFKQCVFPLFCINTIILQKLTDFSDYFCENNILRKIPEFKLNQTIGFDIVFFLFLHLNIIEELLPPPQKNQFQKKTVQEINSIPTFKGKQYVYLVRKKIFDYLFKNNIKPAALKEIFIKLINHYGDYKNETFNLSMPFSNYVENIKNKKLNHILEKYFSNLIFFSSRIDDAYTKYYNNQSK